MKKEPEDRYLADFGVALVRAREAKGWNRSSFARDIGASPNGVKRWEHGEVFPEPRWWGKIRDTVGINPSDYRPPITPTTQGNHNITATEYSSVSVNSHNTKHHHIPAESLTQDEMAALAVIRKIGPKAIEALLLFDQYGNEHILNTCIDRLYKVKSALA